jgi:RNA polymerase sigma factor (sigma-70 family)
VSSEGSITNCIAELRQGNTAAAERLWQRCFPRLAEFAREALDGLPLGAADEEDVALSVMDRFCRTLAEGGFPELADRDELWRLLFQMTFRRAMSLARRERAQRRGGGKVQSDAEGRIDGLRQFLDRTPTPEVAAMMADECRQLLEKLQDPQLQAMALAKMEGYDNREIAAQLHCSVRTVERRLKLVREKWKEEWEFRQT